MSTAHVNVVVIGSGFGGSLTALTLARQFKKRSQNESVLILERGAWWTTPVETIQDNAIKTPAFLEAHKQPYRYWASADHLRGLMDFFLRCVKRPGQDDGVYDITRFGGDNGNDSDGVSVVRANGVGGGSLIYANVTIQPPDSAFASWPITWDTPSAPGAVPEPQNHNQWYDLARHAIGYGVLSAWDSWEKGQVPFTGPNLPDTKPVNIGLSNIATRSARLDPHWKMDQDDPVVPGRKIKQLDPAHDVANVDKTNTLWIDRARVFQNSAGQVLKAMDLPPDYGTVDSSINDLTPEGMVGGPSNYPNKKPSNYCERQGRCILGCLPGARQTLNKQLMRAMFGSPTDPTVVPDCAGNLKLQALCEVYRVAPLPAGGYEIKYRQYDDKDPSKFQDDLTVTADRVIFAGGCIGTTELLLKCKLKERTLPNLSEKLGFGFSTNGDYLAFVENTTDTVNLTRGPVTTSYARFNSNDPEKFHTIEDNGVPKIFSVLFGQGSATLQEFAQNGITTSIIARLVIGELRHLLEQAIGILGGIFQKGISPKLFQSEDIPSRNIMCFAAIGRDQALGQFRLGQDDDTPLRLARTDGIRFHQDPIYTEIKKTLDIFGEKLTGVAKHEFTLDNGDSTVLGVSHPLGGCRMAKDASEGVADEFGRVFGHEGLYIADASLIPSGLGVNPSLTISAVALRVAHQMIEDHYS